LTIEQQREILSKHEDKKGGATMPKRTDATSKNRIRELCEAHTEIEGLIADRKGKPENQVMNEVLEKSLKEITERTIHETKKMNEATAKKAPAAKKG
jgi:hypothetical protein